MKYTATVEAIRIGQPMELCGLCGAPGDYLVVMGDSKILFLRPELFEGLFRPVDGAARNVAQKAAREPKEAAEEPGRKIPVTDLILHALHEGPKRLREVWEWLRVHGQPDYSVAKTSATLAYLRGIQKAQAEDHIWRLKG